MSLARDNLNTHVYATVHARMFIEAAEENFRLAVSAVVKLGPKPYVYKLRQFKRLNVNNMMF